MKNIRIILQVKKEHVGVHDRISSVSFISLFSLIAFPFCLCARDFLALVSSLTGFLLLDRAYCRSADDNW